MSIAPAENCSPGHVSICTDSVSQFSFHERNVVNFTKISSLHFLLEKLCSYKKTNSFKLHSSTEKWVSTGEQSETNQFLIAC